jgi:hypothetical protein
MSLIGEALKRARLDAARREGEERGTAHSSMPAYVPERRRFPTAWVLGLLAACALGVAAAIVLMRPAPPAPTLAVEKVAPTPAAATPEEPASTAAAAAPPPASEPAAPVATVPVAKVPPPAAAAEPPPRPARVEPPAPPGARVYLGVADLGATRLELDGIVASATDPVAMINRKLLGIGEGVDGWVVEKIEPKQVTLHGGSETIVLRLR